MILLQIIDSLSTKLKIKELISILFFLTLILTILPVDILGALGILEFKEKYQAYISLLLIGSIAYYLYQFSKFILDIVIDRFFGPKQIAIKYMRKNISRDEMALIVEKFYDYQENIFKSTGYISYSDGRKAALEHNYILYRSAQVSSRRMAFAYNVQPYALDYLNEKLKKGDIEISQGRFSYTF